MVRDGASRFRAQNLLWPMLAVASCERGALAQFDMTSELRSKSGITNQAIMI